MLKQEILNAAKENFENTLALRSQLHKNAEVGFEMDKTLKVIEDDLDRLNIKHKRVADSGVYAVIGEGERCFLLRSDIDALPIKEESGINCACTSGNMHACGHDIHTASLLSAAAILKNYESKLNGCVKLMFQPAEEILSGARRMIEAGVLENPRVDAAMMLHVMTAVPFETGTVIVSNPGISAPAADYFEIQIEGRGGHGASPEKCIDALTTAAHTVINLEQIPAREISFVDNAVLTVGALISGDAHNIIPNSAQIKGTLRAFSDETRNFMKKRTEEIALKTAETFGAKASVTFPYGTPTLKNDKALFNSVLKYQKELFGNKAFSQSELVAGDNEPRIKSTGSEDFSYVSHEVPSIMLAIAAGNINEGYTKPLHHPKVKFDENVLASAPAVYSYAAMRWLADNK